VIRSGMLPRIGSSKLVSTWIFVTLAASIVGMLDNGWLLWWTALAPERVWHGQVWRLVTWALVETSPLSLVFTCISIYKFGGELAPRWGDRRLRRFMLHVVLAAGAASALGALVSESAWHMYRAGGWAVSDALVIAWARQYPNATLRLYGMIELSGRQLIAFTVGFTALIAISTSPFVMAPELVACFVAAMYPRGWLVK
jgi:membrane associated rhomboid family serine protease